MSDKKVVLAFSGGLDTSFCVPWLKERGFEVTTLFVDTGGVDEDEKQYIATRAEALGAHRHVTLDGADALWQEIVVPLVQARGRYQDQYPLLCSDRYLIVRKATELAREIGTRNIAHGCTAMGNDQVRFDLTLKSLGDYHVIAPVREIQRDGVSVRELEKAFLAERGFGVRDKTATYTVNENLLGVTISGAEIDRFETPGPSTYHLTRPREEWPGDSLQLTIQFEKGIAVAIEGLSVTRAKLLAELNDRFGAYGVGRGVYTGDTNVGLKGRIVYEAPGLTALYTAHRALEEAVFTRHQNAFKPTVAREWTGLVYQGFFYEPLKRDLEAFLRQSQAQVTGSVTLQTRGGTVEAVALQSPHLLASGSATYAQSANWTVTEAEGFIKLFGQSSALWTEINGSSE